MLAYAGRSGSGFYELMRQRYEESQTAAAQTEDDDPAARAEAATANLVKAHSAGHFIEIDPHYFPIVKATPDEVQRRLDQRAPSPKTSGARTSPRAQSQRVPAMTELEVDSLVRAYMSGRPIACSREEYEWRIRPALQGYAALCLAHSDKVRASKVLAKQLKTSTVDLTSSTKARAQNHSALAAAIVEPVRLGLAPVIVHSWVDSV